MLRRALIASLIVHTAVLVSVWRPAVPPALQIGQRLSVDLIASPKQAMPAVAENTASAHIRRALFTAATARDSVREITHEKVRQEKRYAKSTGERNNITGPVASLAPSPQTFQARTTANQPSADGRLTRDTNASTDATVAASQTDSPDGSTAARVKVRLLQALRDHFAYPRIARRYGWEGLVEMHIRVEADGRLSHIELIHSSGYAALDQAALNSTRRIVTVAEAAGWLHGSYIDLLLPVEYRLIDG